MQSVNWYHAIAFCNKLSLAEGLTPVYFVTGIDFSTLTFAAIPVSTNADWDAVTCNWSAIGYRLPTEMEWMWAAMGAPFDGQNGGTNTSGYSKAFAGSTGGNLLGDYAWYNANSDSRTHPAGSKLNNELGLFDMSGNVFEWCWDWNGTYPGGLMSDFKGAESGSYRIARGGSWLAAQSVFYLKERFPKYPDDESSYNGFRVVRR